MTSANRQLSAAATQPDLSTAVWGRLPEHDSSGPDELMLSWLLEPGLLTRRLQHACGRLFNMEVLSDQPCAIGTGLHREVLLRCGERACIYAITDIPASTLMAHDWLARLGSEPLGESLQSRQDVTRSAFAYALLDGRRLPPRIAATNSLWARRSEFCIGTDALSVTEIFLDGLAHCETKPQA